GYYAASVTDASSGAGPILVRFQVTDISFYVSVTQTQTLVWLNNLASGGPVRDAKLRVGGVDVVTGPDGIAVFPTQTIRQRRGVETVAKTADGREAGISASGGPSDIAGLKNRPEVYWRYLYADRPVYRPSETISFWGVALPREKAADAVQRITLSLSDQSGAEAARTTVAVSDGLFSGTLPMPSLRPGSYLLRALIGETSIISRTVRIEDESPASYVLELTSDRLAAIAGDEVVFSAHARYPEGTPIAGL